MQEGKLTRLWTRASDSLPVGWHLAGVMTRDVASKWAFAIGSGTYPQAGSYRLADKLRGVRGDPNG
jgi:hypothetical protein